MSRPFSAEFDLLPSKKYFARLRSQDENEQVFEAELDKKGLATLCEASDVHSKELDEALNDIAEGVIADIEVPEETLTKLGFKDVSGRFQEYRVEVVEGAAGLQKKLVQDSADGYDPLFITQDGKSYTVTSVLLEDEFEDLEDFDDLDLLDEDEDEEDEDEMGELQQ